MLRSPDRDADKVRMAAASIHHAPLTLPAVLVAAGIIAAAMVPMIAAVATVRPMSELDQASACHLLAGALAAQIRVGRAERRWICTVVAALHDLRDSGELLAAYTDPWLGRPRPTRRAVASVSDAVPAAYAVADWWDPAAPRLAHIVAVADEWATLTAASGPELPHAQALTALQARTGTRLDPAVVQAARAIVHREQRFTRNPAFQPRLHRIRSIEPIAVARRLFGNPSPVGSYSR